MTLTWSCIFILFCKIPEMTFARDPSIDAKLEIVVRNFGYPFETHEVVTYDGYVLGMHRIPGRGLANLPPVLLMHGILGSAPDWLVTGPNTSLAFLLHDRGYDVWLGNNRGTTYSKDHLTIDPESAEYWDFSWHEFGLYDTPALIDYVLAVTNYPKLHYIGFSQGCTQFYVMASLRPEYNEKVILMSSLAPAAFTGHVKGFLKPVAALVDFALIVSEFTTYSEFLPNEAILEDLFIFGCQKGRLSEPFCKMSIFLLAGFGLKEEWDDESLPIILRFAPAGCSTKQLLHYGLGIKSPGLFRPYDYGYLKNLKVYDSPSPPEYPLYRITAPVAIYNGINDWLAHPKDVDILAEKLPNLVERYEVGVKLLNHFDFMFGNNIRSLVYYHILERMESYSPLTN